ncbi:hypothetical protein H2201_007008 [Coniosporium apollinis]|uniref:BZIP domain-containing protein n=1 Tax=Coniosporium apollinis TaxID=61459 RepID=A0ABQ9NNV3_9PEZI|nr:hypothetical protein H2201_007008 [Coniosporium apollinis]
MRASANPLNNHSRAPRAVPPHTANPSGPANHGVQGQLLPSFDTLISGLDDPSLRAEAPSLPLPNVSVTLPPPTIESRAYNQGARFDIPVRSTKRALEPPQFTTPDYGAPPPRKRTPSMVECPNPGCAEPNALFQDQCSCGMPLVEAKIVESGRSSSPDSLTASRVCHLGLSSRTSSVSASRRGSKSRKPPKDPVKAEKEKARRAQQKEKLAELEELHRIRGWVGSKQLQGRNRDESKLTFRKVDGLQETIDHLKEQQTLLQKKDERIEDLNREVREKDGEIDALRRALEAERAGNAQCREIRCYTPDSSMTSSASSSPRTERYPPKQVKREDL